MATNENIRVVQLTDDNDNPVSPVVNVGSLYDKNGNKVDNLLSYKLAGTNVPVPKIKNVQDELTQKVDKAILDMKTQVEAFTMNGGLPVNDVRSAVVADGQTINAGDVVDVVDGKATTTIKNVEPAEIVLASRIHSYIDSVYNFNGTYVCATSCLGEGSGGPVIGSFNDNGIRNSNTINLSGSAKFCGLVKVSDTQLIAYSQGSSSSDYDSEVYVETITTTDGFKTLVRSTTNTTRTDADVWEYRVVQIDSTHALLVYMNSGKIHTSIVTYNGTSATYDGKSNVTQAAHGLELTRINDDSATGSIRFLLTYVTTNCRIHYTGTPAASAARIISVGTDYTVTIGDQVNMFSDKTAYITSAFDGTRAYVLSQNTANNTWRLKCVEVGTSGVSCTTTAGYFKLDTLTSNIMTSASNPVDWSNSAGIMCKNGYVICFITASGLYKGYPAAFVTKYDTSNTESFLKTVSSNKLASYNAYAMSAFDIPNNKIGFTCVGGSSINDASQYDTKYGIVYEKYGSVAGEFKYNSTEAIALESGSPGVTISVGYGGYCRMTGAASGTKIESNGVCATSPCDGWLDVTPKYKSVYTGTYTGTGTYGSTSACKITGVKGAKAVIVSAVQCSRWGCDPVVLTRTSYSEGTFAETSSMHSGIGETGSTKCNTLYYKFDGDSLTWYSSTDPSQFNTSGDVYSYTIIR